MEASLNYLINTGERPMYYLYTPLPSAPRRTGQHTPHTLLIHDGQAILAQLSLDQYGFM